MTRFKEEEEDEEVKMKELPLFTMPDSLMPAKFFFYFDPTPASLIIKRQLEDAVMRNGGTLTYSGRTTNEVWHSSQPDIDIFVCGSEGRYAKAKTRFATSNQTRVFLANQIQSWLKNGRFDLPRLTVRAMPGRFPAQERTRTNFTPEDEQLVCRFLARWCPYKENGGRQGLIAYKQMLNSYWDWPGAQRHSAESWRTFYKNNMQKLDPIIDSFVEEDPPNEDELGMDSRRRRAGKQQHSLDDYERASLDDNEEDVGRADSLRARSKSLDMLDFPASTPPQSPPHALAQKRRATEDWQDASDKKRLRQKRQIRSASSLGASRRHVKSLSGSSIAGSDIHHAIDVDAYDHHHDIRQPQLRRRDATQLVADPSYRPAKKVAREVPSIVSSQISHSSMRAPQTSQASTLVGTQRHSASRQSDINVSTHPGSMPATGKGKARARQEEIEADLKLEDYKYWFDDE